MMPLGSLSKFGKGGLIASMIAGSMIFGGVGTAQAWDATTHSKIAQAAGAKIPKLATMPDIFRTGEHYIDNPFVDVKKTQAFLDTIKTADTYTALHYIADATQPLHMYEYTKNHTAFDTAAKGLTSKELAGIKPSTGNFVDNLKKEMELSRYWAENVEGKGLMMSRSGAIKRVKSAVALSKQYLLENPEVGKWDVNLKGDLLARKSQMDTINKYAATLTDTTDVWQGKEHNKAMKANAGLVVDALEETAITESAGLTKDRQVGKGPARSIYQVEKRTARDIVHGALKKPDRMSSLMAASGKTKRQLLGMNKASLGAEMMKNDLFGAVLARYNWSRDKEPIAGTTLERSTQYADHYWAGEKTKRATKATKYVNDNAALSKRVSAAMISQQKTLSKMGAGSMAGKKAARFLKKILPR